MVDRRPFLKRLLHSLRAVEKPGARAKAVETLVDLCRALVSERGEASGAQLATDVIDAYQTLDPSLRELFFDQLADDWGPEASAIDRAADAYQADRSPAHLIDLQNAVESPRQELFRRWNMAPGGTASLIQMRQQLLPALGNHPQWAPVDADLLHLFRSWFNRGFLKLERIDWRTSALVLERLIHYEAVHEIQGWRDLRRRLEVDRRCYAFFHPALPEEPLIFIEVALTSGLSASVQPLLDPDSAVVDPDRIDSAMFYSITSCQDGLRGVSFGNLLIKQVAEDLGKEFRRIRLFATLSPVPGFAQWLASGAPGAARLSEGVRHLVSELGNGTVPESLTIPASLRDEIIALCARYLLHAKAGRAPADPVARFHLANGARLERLNWGGDRSPAGLRRSLGVTANYVYRLRDVERNHEGFAKSFRVTATPELERLARRFDPATKQRSAKGAASR